MLQSMILPQDISILLSDKHRTAPVAHGATKVPLLAFLKEILKDSNSVSISLHKPAHIFTSSRDKIQTINSRASALFTRIKVRVSAIVFGAIAYASFHIGH